MLQLLFLALLIPTTTLISNNVDQILADLSTENYFPYQDIIVNDNILWKGLGPDCQSRYTAIHDALAQKYDRPITVLDIGANNGFFSISLARDMNGQSVMIDTTNRLTNICNLNTNFTHQLFYIKKQINTEDLKKLGKKIHFDVVIALHVLHHIPEWKSFIEELLTIADTVIIETPPTNDPRLSYKTNITAIEEELISRGGTIITQTPRVAPGKHHNLEKMVYGQQLEIITLPDTQSSMFIFDAQSCNKSFHSISTEDLATFPVEHPKL